MSQNVDSFAETYGQASENLTEKLNEGFQMNNEAIIDAIKEQEAEKEQEAKQEAFQKHFGKKTKDGYSKTQAEEKKKRKREESSITQNVTNGEGFVDVLETYGPAWNPILEVHSVAGLTLRNAAARDLLNDVRTERQDNSSSVASRREQFDILPGLFTRMFNQLEACGASKGIIKNAKHVLDLSRGDRMGTPKPDAKTISVSHASDSEMVDHLSNFIAVLKNCPQYDSNQPELKIPALETYRDSLLNENSGASKSKASLETTMNGRNKFFNDKNTGYVDTFQAAKRAAKAIFGGNSVEYHQLAKFRFRRIHK